MDCPCRASTLLSSPIPTLFLSLSTGLLWVGLVHPGPELLDPTLENTLAHALHEAGKPGQVVDRGQGSAQDFADDFAEKLNRSKAKYDARQGK